MPANTSIGSMPAKPIDIPVEGQGDRVALQLQASIDPLYAEIANLPNVSMSNWQAGLNIDPENTGLELWTGCDGGSPLTPAGFSALIGFGNYNGNVWVSADNDLDPVVSLIYACAELALNPLQMLMSW